MGWFDFLRRKDLPPDLLSQFIRSVARHDVKTFAQLCERNEQEILDSFPTWRKLPDSVLSSTKSQQQYVETLIEIAQAFAQAGHPQLMALLTGSSDDNPILRWQDDLANARILLEGGSFQDANQKLLEMLSSMAGNRGSGVDKYRPMALGMLGIVRFRMGNLDLAREATQQALDQCRSTGDEEGVRTYTQNLRLMNDGAAVIYKDPFGRELTTADLLHSTGTVKFELITHENVNSEARKLYQDGRAAGGAQDYPRALAALQQAMELAPDWPAPVYDMAFTYLLMRDYDRALQFYRKTIELSPKGFFTAFTAIHTLEREMTGDLPEGTYFGFVMLEWLDQTTRENIVRQMVVKLPNFAPVWKELALLETTLAGRQAALNQGLNANPDVETFGTLKLNQALMLNEQGQKAEAVEILAALAIDPNSTLTTSCLAKETLAQLI